MARATIWRARPVLITSTFRDMQAERDWLRARVFPELEERLRTRRWTLEPIDLRWGVETAGEAEEHAREMRVLQVCLTEVERSRPFLIGLVGDRYGWIPPPDRMEAAAREAGFDAPVAGRSVTDLEIDYGVLSSPAQRCRSLFFLREPLPYAEMPVELAAEYSEGHRPGGAEAARKLAALKARIERELPGRVHRYRARWDAASRSVSGLEEWGKQVVEALWRELDAETADSIRGDEASWQEVERFALEEFADARAGGFVGREDTLAELLALARSPAGEGPWGACLTGPAGAGKSAIFAELWRRLRESDALVLAHSAGVSPRAGRVDAMLRRWVGELSAALEVPDPLQETSSAEDVEKAFQELLGRASARRRVVLLVDALNQFEPAARAGHLAWLPRYWPGNARLVATAVPGDEAETVGRRPGVRLLPVPPLSIPEAGWIAQGVCRRYHRELAAPVLAALVDKQRADGSAAAGNALWLELAVEELNLLDAADFARAESEFQGRPDERVRKLLLAVVEEMPAEVEGLYGWMLDRAERSFGAPLARAFASLIAVSRTGWRESDLRVLLPRLAGQPWDELVFAQLRRAFRAHVVRKGSQGQWDFAHDQARLAVQGRYLANHDEVRRLHAAVAEHLLVLPREDPLHESETMVHLAGAGDGLGAARYYASELTPGEAAGATQALAERVLAGGQQEPNPGVEWVRALLQAPKVGEPEGWMLSKRVLFDVCEELAGGARVGSRLQVVDAVRRQLQRMSTTAPGRTDWGRDLAVSRSMIGDILVEQGDSAGALAEYRASLAALKDLPEWRRDLATTHNRIGKTLLLQGDRAGALTAHRTALAVQEWLVSVAPDRPTFLHDLSVSHESIGAILVEQGDDSGALASRRAALAVQERLAALEPNRTQWQDDLAVVHDGMGDILLARGDLAEALAEYRAALAIREHVAALEPARVEWQRGLAVSWNRIGTALRARRDAAGAVEAYRSSLTVAQRLAAADPESADRQRDLAVGHQTIGSALLDLGDTAGALAAHRSSAAIARRLAQLDPERTDWQRNLSVSLDAIGNTLLARGDPAGALADYRSALTIAERLAARDPGQAAWQRDLLVSHVKVGDVLVAQGDVAGALAGYRIAQGIADALVAVDPQRPAGHHDVGVCHGKIGDLLLAKGDAAEALAQYRAALASLETRAALIPAGIESLRDVLLTHGKIADVELRLGDTEAALAQRRSACEIAERMTALDPDHQPSQRDLAVSHARLGDALQARGDGDGALAAYRASLEIRERLAARAPDSVQWRRELAVFHYVLADFLERHGGGAQTTAHLRHCREILLAMKQARVQLERPLLELLDSLGSRLESGGRPTQG